MQTKYDISVELEDLSQVKKKLNIVIPADTVNREIKGAYQSLKSTAAVAGFRKGAVPLNILKARFGGHIQEDVTKRLIEQSYPHAMHEKELAPVEAPKIDIKTPKLEEGKEFTYSVTVEVNPKIEIDGYRGMDIKREEVEVTEKDIEDGINTLRDGRAEFKEVGRAAKEGDMITMDFESFLDGKPIKNGKGADYGMILGQTMLLPGFDDAVRGASKGEVKDARIKFPENYSEPDLKGREADFKITVKAVKEKELPALDDELAKDLDCENLQALREKVKEEVRKVKEHNEKERVKNAILDRLIEKHQFEVPEALVNKYHGIILNRVIENMRQGVFAPEDNGLSPEALRAKYHGLAVRQVKEDTILDLIASKEKLEVSKEELENAVKHLAAQRNVGFDALMGRIEREGALEVIKDGLKHEKVFDIIIDSIKSAS